MKNTIFVIIALCCFSTAQAQFKSEFDYFSFSIGITHSILNVHEQGGTAKALLMDHIDENGSIIQGTYEQLFKNDNQVFNYGMGFNAGIYYNHDLKNDDMGFTVGVLYQNYPYKVKYISGQYDQEVTEKTNIHTVSIPVYFKYGKRFYEPQRYVYFGAQANYHFSGTQNYEYPTGTTNYILEKDYINKFTASVFAGFNYKIFNIKLEYLPLAILNDSPIEIENLAENQGHARHFVCINTNIHLPITSWTFGKNKKPLFKFKNLKRIFK